MLIAHCDILCHSYDHQQVCVVVIVNIWITLTDLVQIASGHSIDGLFGRAVAYIYTYIL